MENNQQSADRLFGKKFWPEKKSKKIQTSKLSPLEKTGNPY
jgi:hypothetical protein